MTARQILDVAMGAGFRGDDAVIAVAIALAESDGDPNALNPWFWTRGQLMAKPHGNGSVCGYSYCGDYSLGLWQVNMRPDIRQTRLSLWGLSSVEDLYQPEVNARAAYSLYRGRGGKFGDWSTFLNSAYLNRMPSARTAFAIWAAEQTVPPVIPPAVSTRELPPLNPPAPLPIQPATAGASLPIPGSLGEPMPNPGSSVRPSFWRFMWSLIDNWLERRGL